MSFFNLKNEILDNELCASCGACISVCPTGILDLNDAFLPEAKVNLNQIEDICLSCNICSEICPGKHTDVPASEEYLFRRHREQDERWTGIVQESNLVSVIDESVRSQASAGGAATGLLITALRTGLVEAVLVIGRDKERPWVPKAVLTNNEQEIIDCAQSTYCIAPNLQLLKETKYKKIGMVGLACEIQAVRKMQRNPLTSHIGNKVIFTVEIACASSTKLEGTEHLIKNKLNLPLEDVSKVRYRDGEYPGDFTAYTKNGNRHTLDFFELVLEFKKFKTYRCLACRDWWSGIADISISDGDPNIYASSKYGDIPERFSMVLTRTDIGTDLLNMGIEQGLLVAKPQIFNPDESLGLQRKRFRGASFARKYPDNVPDSAVLFPDNEEEKDDDLIIQSMSNRIS